MSFWWCTRRISPDCTVMVPTSTNVPQGRMCDECRKVLHRYYCSNHPGQERFAAINRQRKSRKAELERERRKRLREEAKKAPLRPKWGSMHGDGWRSASASKKV